MDSEQVKALRAWDLMGQKLDWAALEAVSLYLEVQDIDLFIDSLILFKGFNDQHQRAQWQTQQQA